MAQPSQEHLDQTPPAVQEYLASLHQHTQALQERLTDQAARNFKPPKLQDPTCFDGSRNTRLLSEYLYDIKQHFKNDPLKFALNDAKVRFAGSYLKNTARTWFRTMDESDSPWTTFDGFEAALKEHFSELDPEEYWRKRWDTLQQRGPIASYLADFQSITMHLVLTDQDKYHHFKKGLRPSVLDQLALMPKPASFQELVKLANQIDARLFEHVKTKNNNIKPPQRPQPGNNFQRQTNGFNSGYRPQQRPPFTPTYPNNQQVQSPRWYTPANNHMQLDTMTKGPLSEAEKSRRRLNNLCLYCGQPGHTAFDCPLKRGRPHNGQGQPPKPKN